MVRNLAHGVACRYLARGFTGGQIVGGSLLENTLLQLHSQCFLTCQDGVNFKACQALQRFEL
jgi:hypothetical protein